MDNTFKVITRSEAETIELAENIESEKFPNMVICLNGDLGSGKTVFTKGFAGAMGIDEITSQHLLLLKNMKVNYLYFIWMYIELMVRLMA